MKTKNIVRLYYLITFLFDSGLHFFAATYVLFLTETVGLNPLEVNTVNSCFALSVFLLELPTGVFADLKGRKQSTVFACIFFSLSMLVYYLARTFWMCALAETIAAIGISLRSGAFDAWLVDSLPENTDLDYIFRKKEQFRRLGSLCGSIVSGYLGLVSLSFPWICSSLSMIFVAILCHKVMTENDLDQDAKPEFRKIVRESVMYGIKHKAVFALICFSTFCFFVYQPMNMFWQLRFRSLGMAQENLGWVFAGISVFIVVGSQCSVLFLKIGSWRGMILSQLVTAFAMVVAGSSGIYGCVLVSFMMHEFGRGVFEPLRSAYINRRIPETKRATILSFESMINKAGMASGLLISGLLAKSVSIQFSWIIFGSILALALPAFLCAGNGEKGD